MGARFSAIWRMAQSRSPRGKRMNVTVTYGAGSMIGKENAPA